MYNPIIFKMVINDENYNERKDETVNPDQVRTRSGRISKLAKHFDIYDRY